MAYGIVARRRRTMPILEVYPVQATEGSTVVHWYVRLKGVNGRVVLVSPEGFSKESAIRSAKAINTTIAMSRLDIRILNDRERVVRVLRART